MNKETLRIFYFIETIDKMYFYPDDSVRFVINLHIDDKNPKNPRIVELFYFPYKKFHFENLYRAIYRDKRHYSSFEMENDGRIYEIIDKSSPELKEQFAQKIISFVDKDLEKAREIVSRNIITLINIYAQTIKGLENMIKAAEKGKDLHILKKLFEGSIMETNFLEHFKFRLNFLIYWLRAALHKLKRLEFNIQEAEYTILYEKHKKHQKLYVIKVRFVTNWKSGYAYYNILIDDDKIKVGIEVEYDVRKDVEEIYKAVELVVRPFGWSEWSSEKKYREKATNSWYYLLRPVP